MTSSSLSITKYNPTFCLLCSQYLLFITCILLPTLPAGTTAPALSQRSSWEHGALAPPSYWSHLRKRSAESVTKSPGFEPNPDPENRVIHMSSFTAEPSEWFKQQQRKLILKSLGITEVSSETSETAEESGMDPSSGVGSVEEIVK